MRRIYTFVMLAALLMPGEYAAAQKRAKKETPKTDPRIERMVQATQDIIFIDSIVVDRDGFLGRYNLNPESGSLYGYSDFFKDEGQPEAYVHVNEMGNKCYYSRSIGADSTRLYTSDMLDGAWTDGTEMDGICDGVRLTTANYPFMMADGTTLYFAAKGSESIGGYDIFVTRFDMESGSYLKPENIGMPFNSEANDYMYAIDELDSIGWFVTDRNQPEGKVCIYTFIPADSRQTYSPDEYTGEQLKRLAAIGSIADTWKDGSARDRALARLRGITEKKDKQKSRGDFAFVINDNVTYRRLADFRSAENAGRYNELTSLRAKARTLEAALRRARDYYATAEIHERNELRGEILKSERQYEAFGEQIRKLEKEIRNSENNLLK